MKKSAFSNYVLLLFPSVSIPHFVDSIRNMADVIVPDEQKPVLHIISQSFQHGKQINLLNKLGYVFSCQYVVSVTIFFSLSFSLQLFPLCFFFLLSFSFGALPVCLWHWLLTPGQKWGSSVHGLLPGWCGWEMCGLFPEVQCFIKSINRTMVGN